MKSVYRRLRLLSLAGLVVSGNPQGSPAAASDQPTSVQGSRAGLVAGRELNVETLGCSCVDRGGLEVTWCTDEPWELGKAAARANKVADKTTDGSGGIREGSEKSVYVLKPSLKKGGIKNGVLSFCADVLFMSVREQAYPTRERANRAATLDAFVGSVAASALTGWLLSLVVDNDDKDLAFWGGSAAYFAIAFPLSRDQLVKTAQERTMAMYRGEWVFPEEAGLVKWTGLWIDRDQFAWEHAKYMGTIGAYDEYMVKFPAGRYANEAAESRAMADSVMWRGVDSVATKDSYRHYLETNPMGRFADTARARIEDLDWDEVVDTDTNGSYVSYLQDYPSGRYRAAAESRVKEIEDAVWNRAVASGSVESAVAYMKQYPSGRYFEEARRTAERGSMELAEATETVRETEDSIIQLLREGNLRDHFVITTIKPQSTAFSWFRGTLKEVVTPDGPFASEIVYVREFPADPEALHPTGGPWKVFHGIIEDRRGGRLTFGEKGLPQEFFTSKNAIHRYDGRVEREDGYTFIGEGDKWNRLTFAVLDTGYVYVRGIGRVVLPDGKEVTLGGPAAQPPKKK